MLYTRWVGSIVGTCEIRLTEIVQDRLARAVAELECYILGRPRVGTDRREDANLDMARARQSPAW